MANILTVTDLRKIFKQWFDSVDILKGVNINVDKGEIYWFLWPNWAGKTTTLKCILWFLKYNAWNVYIFWEEVKDNFEIYKRIGYAPENTYFYDHLNGLEFLIFMWQLTDMTKQEAELNWLDLLERVGLSFAKNRQVRKYSKWMKQRLWLASSLINDPDLVFLDEPMSGLDPLGRVLVKDLMLDLKQKGKTIFFNTHILSDVEEVADRFWIIYNGNIVYSEEVKKLWKSLEKLFKEVVEEETEKSEIG